MNPFARWWSGNAAKQEERTYTPSTPPPQPLNAPAKVFVDKDGQYDEWTLQRPGEVESVIADILYGAYWQQNLMELFYCLPEVFSPIHEIASRVADAVWELRKDWNDEVDYKDEVFNRLFTQPNPLQTHKELIYHAVCYEILVGKQYFFLNIPEAARILSDDYRMVQTWSNLPAAEVRLKLRNTDPYTATEIGDFVEYYELPNKRKFEVNQVMPILHLNLKYGYNLNECVPLIKGAEKAIRNLIPVYEARGAIYIKRGALGFLVSRATDANGTVSLTPKERQELEKDHQQAYGVTYGKHTMGISRLPIDYVQTGMSIKDLMPFDETLSDAVAIYKVLRVPRHFVPSKDLSTYANADSDEKSFYGNVIIPWATKYADVFNKGFKFSENRRYVFPSYAHVPLLQENLKEKADIDKVKTETVILKYEKGIIMKNERQAELGYSSLPDGNTYSTDPDNTEPLGIRLDVGTMQSMMTVITNPSIEDSAKVVMLVDFFGVAQDRAALMVKTKKIETDGNNTSPEDKGTKGQGGAN